MRHNWLSNRVFTSYDDIIDLSCEAWNKITPPYSRLATKVLASKAKASRLCDFKCYDIACFGFECHLPNPFSNWSLFVINLTL
jgi:hypothetical protein